MENDINFTKASELLFSTPFQTDSNSDEKIVKRKRKIRRFISDDEDINSIEQSFTSTYIRPFIGNDETLWTNVTENENYCHIVNFSIGKNV